MNKIERGHASKGMRILFNEDLSTVASIAGFSAGTLHFPGSFDMSMMYVLVGPDPATMSYLYDHLGNQVTIPAVADAAVFLPPECFGAAYLQFEGDAGGESANVDFTLELTS